MGSFGMSDGGNVSSGIYIGITLDLRPDTAVHAGSFGR